MTKIKRGTSIGIVGVTSTGKSTLLNSAAKVGRTAIAVCPASERDSYEHVEDVTVFMDELWLPRFDKWQATGWLAFLKWFADRIADESVQIIGHDTTSELSELAWHEALKMYRTEDPSSLGANWGAPWQVFAGLITEYLNMVDIAVSRGKIVIASWHGEMREQEGIGEPSKDRKGDVSWNDTMMPSIRGKMRQIVPARFSLWLHAGITPAPSPNLKAKRFVSDSADSTKIGRSRAAVHLDGGPKWDNDLETLLKAARLLDGTNAV